MEVMSICLHVIGDDSRSLPQVTIIFASSVVQCGEAF